MRKLVAVVAFAFVASTAMAQPYYLAGSMQGWNPGNGDVLAEISAGTHYQITWPGLSGDTKFKVTDGTWGAAWPGSNAETDLGAGPSTLTVDFYPGAQSDGWSPSSDRVGFTDLGLTTWEVIGDFDGWGAGQATMNPLGGGMYTTTMTVATAGTHEFKFRRAGDWSLAIGFEPDSTGTGGNAVLTTTVPNELVVIEMDIPNGRYRITPEPATLALLGLGGLALIRRRR